MEKGDTGMANWNRNLPRLALSALVVVAVGACAGGSAEKGVLPDGAPHGEVVALEYDAARDRLLKAYPAALYESADGGVSWNPIPLPGPGGDGRITAVAASDSGRALYVAGRGIGVIRSTDAGQTWTSRADGLPSRHVTAFAIHSDQPGTLYAAFAKEGIYRSEDAGARWKKMDGGPGAEIRQFLHSGMEGSMQTGWLFAATPDGVRRSMDCFCGWRPAGKLPDGAVLDVAYDPMQPKRVYASTDHGLFRSGDGGETWVRGSADPIAGALAVDRAGTLFSAARDGTVLRSADQGLSWEQSRA